MYRAASYLIIQKSYSVAGTLQSQRSRDEKFATWEEANEFMATLPQFPYGEAEGETRYHISAPRR